MKYIFTLIKNIKNLLPYLLLIAVYFFFVNLEVKKEQNTDLKSEKDRILDNSSSSLDKKSSRLVIPVIPYSE